MRHAPTFPDLLAESSRRTAACRRLTYPREQYEDKVPRFHTWRRPQAQPGGSSFLGPSLPRQIPASARPAAAAADSCCSGSRWEVPVHRGRDRLMPEPALHHEQVRPLSDQPGRIRMPKIMDAGRLGQPRRCWVRLAVRPNRMLGPLDRLRPVLGPERRVQDRAAQRVHEQELVTTPPVHQRTQLVDQSLGQRHRPPRALRLRRTEVGPAVLAALPRAHHPHRRRRPVQDHVTDLKGGRLVPAQPGSRPRTGPAAGTAASSAPGSARPPPR